MFGRDICYSNTTLFLSIDCIFVFSMYWLPLKTVRLIVFYMHFNSLIHLTTWKYWSQLLQFLIWILSHVFPHMLKLLYGIKNFYLHYTWRTFISIGTFVFITYCDLVVCFKLKFHFEWFDYNSYHILFKCFTIVFFFGASSRQQMLAILLK